MLLGRLDLTGENVERSCTASKVDWWGIRRLVAADMACMMDTKERLMVEHLALRMEPNCFGGIVEWLGMNVTGTIEPRYQFS